MSEHERLAAGEGLVPSAPSGNGAGNGEMRPSSLLAHLRQERDERAAQRTLDLPIPGWQGDDGYGLIVRLRALTFGEDSPLTRRMAGIVIASQQPGRAVRRSAQEEQADAEAEVSVYADALIRACVDIRIRTPDGDTLPLDETPAAEPCRFDARTCSLLSLPRSQTAREAVMLIYRRDAFALEAAWGELTTFTRSARSEEGERLLGETGR